MPSHTNELRVFVSSTFRDLQEEREHLVKKIFPEIRSLCRERGITFTEVDLRWGLTEEDGTLGRVIRTCLEEIDRCRPYFIGITGERYGYIPDLVEIYKDPELLARFPWIEDAAMEGASIIDLEFRHATLDDPPGLRPFPMSRGNRDGQEPVSSDVEPSGVNSPGIFFFRRGRERLEPVAISDRWSRAETDVDVERLEALKQRVRNDGLPVEEFRDPVSLGELVYDHLVRIIKRDFADARPPTPLERERARHAAFAASRTRAYIPNPVYLKRLNDWVEPAPATPLILYAESGSGKSSLLAFWCAAYRRRNSQAFVVEHYVGIGAGGNDHLAIIRHVMEEIKERYGLSEEIPSKPEELEREFANWLGFTPLEGGYTNGAPDPLVLVIDGINQLTGAALELRWLPPVMPPNVRLLISSTVERTLVDLRSRGWAELGVQPLKEREREAVTVRFLAEYHKSLAPEQVSLIAEDAKCAHPLFLRTLLEELRLHGTHEHLEGRLGHYLESTGTEDLFQRVLERLEDDYSQKVVREVMSLLWASRTGLSEADLTEMTGISRLKLAALVLSLEYHLLLREGLLGFFHDYLRRAVEKRYLGDRQKQRAVHLRLAEYFQAEIAALRAGEVLTRREATELTHQLHAAGETEQLKSALASMPVFLVLYEGETLWTVLAYWAELGAGEGMEKLYERELEQREFPNDRERSGALGRVADLLERLGCWEGAIRTQRRRLQGATERGDRAEEAAARRGLGWPLQARGEYDAAFEELARARDLYLELGDRSGLSFAIGSMGNVFSRRGEYDRALECYREQETICRELGDHWGLSVAKGNVGNVFSSRGEYDRALECYREQEAICRQLGARSGLSRAIGNMGLVYWSRGEYERTLECFQDQETICRELGDRSGLSLATGNMGGVYYSRGEYDRALECFREQETIGRELGDRQSISNAIGNIGTVYWIRGEYDSALECFREQEAICRELGVRSGLSRAIGNMGVVYADRGEHDRALEHLRQAAEEHRAIGFRSDLTHWLAGTARLLVDLAGSEGAMPEFLPAYVPGAAEAIPAGNGEPVGADESIGHATADSRSGPVGSGSWRALSLNAARAQAEECVAISTDLPKPDMLFEGRVLLARIDAAEGSVDTALTSLSEMLASTADDEQCAELHYWLGKLGDAGDHGAEALRLYEALVARTPKHEYRQRIEEFRNSV